MWSVFRNAQAGLFFRQVPTLSSHYTCNARRGKMAHKICHFADFLMLQKSMWYCNIVFLIDQYICRIISGETWMPIFCPRLPCRLKESCFKCQTHITLDYSCHNVTCFVIYSLDRALIVAMVSWQRVCSTVVLLLPLKLIKTNGLWNISNMIRSGSRRGKEK